MAWATIALARLLSGLSTTDISDADLTSLIPYADLKIKGCVFMSMADAELDGDINSSNKEFRVPSWPIADYDASGTVDADDLTLWSVKEDSTTGFEESTEITISSVNARDGIVTLDTAPDSTTVDYVVSDYHLTKKGIGSTQLEHLASLALSYLAFCNVAGTKGSTPESYSWDGFRVTKGSSGDSLERRANTILSQYKNECLTMRPAQGIMNVADTNVTMTGYLDSWGA